MATIRIRGVNLRYEIVGDGGPLVTLITGGPARLRRVPAHGAQIIGGGIFVSCCMTAATRGLRIF